MHDSEGEASDSGAWQVAWAVCITILLSASIKFAVNYLEAAVERRKLARGEREQTHDFLVVGGGVSGCYLAALLCERFPKCSVCLVNLGGHPPWWTATYILNLVGIVLPTTPSVDYSGCDLAHKRQFVNATWLGGNSNLNAGVCPIPQERDIKACLGDACVPMFREFRDGEECKRVCRPVDMRAPGLDGLSRDMIEKLSAEGGPIHVHSEGWKRLRPSDIIEGKPNLTVIQGRAKRLLWDEAYFEKSGRERACGVDVEVPDGICGLGERCFNVYAAREVILCCGAIETPKLLLSSGLGKSMQLGMIRPRVVPRIDDDMAKEMQIGQNLKDHWTARFKVELPLKFRKGYNLCSSQYVLSHKHRFKDLSVGFGKWRALGMGKALVSVGTTRCLDTGGVDWDFRTGYFLPHLQFGSRDRELYEKQLQELRSKLKSHLGIKLIDDFVPGRERHRAMHPNWHYCGTCSEAVRGNGDLRVKYIERLQVADLSVLSDIPPANTQIWAYIVAWVALCGMQTREKDYPSPVSGSMAASGMIESTKKNQ